MSILFQQFLNFYPRSPCGERHQANLRRNQHQRFLSTLSLRRATDVIAVMTEAQSISIHALLAESDLTSVVNSTGTMDFYPRSPCGERPPLTSRAETIATFLSTLSLRRATSTTLTFPGFGMISIHALLAESDGGSTAKHGTARNFYPRSPCGERLFR